MEDPKIVTKTFNEVLYADSSAYIPWSQGMEEAIKAYYNTSDALTSPPSEEAYRMLISHALLKIGARVAVYYEEGDKEAENEARCRMLGWLKASEDRYKPIINAYKQESDLLRKVMTKDGVSVMPQTSTMNDFLGANPEKDDLNRVTVRLADGMTPIERIREINDSITSVYEDWANEFVKTFAISL